MKQIFKTYEITRKTHTANLPACLPACGSDSLPDNILTVRMKNYTTYTVI
jgi:hypothetical protein